MYGLDPDTDLSELGGGTFTFVGFGQYQLQLAFSGATDCSMSVEGHHKVSDPAGPPVTYADAVAGGMALLRLLGRTIESATVAEGGTVHMIFDDGSLVDVLDSESHDESYQVNLGDRLIVV